MGHSVLCLLIITLVFVDLLSAGTLVYTPGSCPADKCECSTDFDCGPGRRCCQFGCVRRCVPYRERCPNFPNLRCDQCDEDHDCLRRGDKCCFINCRKQCVKPIVITNPGFCPNPSSIRCPNTCSSDKDCQRWGRLCCNEGCRKTCVRPDRDNPKECPPAKGEICDKCFTDGECGECQKCCKNDCGHNVCVPASKNECSSNPDCGPGRKCCSNGCTKTCVSGNCPYLLYPHPGMVCHECSLDTDCCGKCNKCKYVGNRKKCVNEVQDPKCGAVALGCFPCGVNGKCFRGQTCCDVGCGFYACLGTENGKCPPPNNKDCCCSDSNCHNGQKCCIKGCEKRCLSPPGVSHPVSCPVNLLPPGCITCSRDNECRPGQICCDNGCGFKICLPPGRRRKCPCPNDEECCFSDHECSRGQKCCIKGCGKFCVNLW